MHYLLPVMYLYYLILFALSRLVFILFNYHLLLASSHSFKEIAACFYHSLPLDSAVAAQLMLIPWLIMLLNGNAYRGWSKLLVNLFVALATIMYTLIALGDTAIYPEWQVKLNMRALNSLQHPSELWHIAPLGETLFFVGLWLLISGASYLIFLRMAGRLKAAAKRSSWLSFPLGLIWAGLLFYAIRGGAGPIVIDISRVYYSKDTTLNDAAANSLYSLGKNVMQNEQFLFGKNPYVVLPPKDAERNVVGIYREHTLLPADSNPTNGERTQVLTTTRPNLVFLVLESWSSDMITSLGGTPGLTPEFARLEREGISFSHFYANGNRSQQGMAAIFAAFPSTPHVTVTEDPSKTRNLPKFAKILEQHGYRSTSFVYGGDLEYGNIKAFLLTNGFSNLIEEHDFDKSVPRANLGVHDGLMLDYYAGHLHKQPEPFLAAAFTLNSHMPYDIPDPENFKFEGIEAGYVKSVMYADREIGRFFNMVKNEPWYQNTLFILVADHSHASYHPRSNWEPNYRKIPMLMYGPAIKPQYRGTTWTRIGSQIDIPATLLAQLGVDGSPFAWSKDLFNPHTAEFGYYELNNGFGWITKSGALAYDFDNKRVVYTDLKDKPLQEAILAGCSFLQVLMQRFSAL